MADKATDTKDKVTVRLKKAPWAEIHEDFYVLETPQGCLVKTEGMLTFVPNAHVVDFDGLVS